MRPWIVVALIAACGSSASAQDDPDRHRPPRLAAVSPDWDAARKATPFRSGEKVALERLNDALAGDFRGIAESPVPVLLPLDVPRLMQDRADGAAGPIEGYLAGLPAPRGGFARAGGGGAGG